MAGYRVTALAKEVADRGKDPVLAARIIHAAERDEHDNWHNAEFETNCLYCQAEIGEVHETYQENSTHGSSSSRSGGVSYADSGASDGFTG